MATPNYAFAKRQRDLAKKQKKAEKLLKKTGTGEPAPDDVEAPVPLPVIAGDKPAP
jgi:hypothetical protein